MIYRHGVSSETYTIQTPRGRWVYLPQQSTDTDARFVWYNGSTRICATISRADLADSAFDVGADLDKQADKILQG